MKILSLAQQLPNMDYKKLLRNRLMFKKNLRTALIMVMDLGEKFGWS